MSILDILQLIVIICGAIIAAAGIFVVIMSGFIVEGENDPAYWALIPAGIFLLFMGFGIIQLTQ